MTQENFEQLQNAFPILLGTNKDAINAISRDFVLRAKLLDEARTMTKMAYEGNHQAYRQMHEFLYSYCNQQFSMIAPECADVEPGGAVIDLVSIFEDAYLADEESRVDWASLPEIPTAGPEFVRWFREVAQNHAAWNHPFYTDFMAHRADTEDFRYFLTQETSLDPRFDDLLALIQIGTTGDVKMEIANNYWDEMGGGQEAEVHTVLFSRALESLGVDDDYVSTNISLMSKSSGNLTSLLGLKRRHFYKALGYFGISEYMAPHRFKCVLQGWRRNKLPPAGVIYHDLHIGVDSGHALGWMNNAIAPLVENNPGAAKEMARGALYRLNNSARYLDSMTTDRLSRVA